MIAVNDYEHSLSFSSCIKDWDTFLSWWIISPGSCPIFCRACLCPFLSLPIAQKEWSWSLMVLCISFYSIALYSLITFHSIPLVPWVQSSLYLNFPCCPCFWPTSMSAEVTCSQILRMNPLGETVSHHVYTFFWLAWTSVFKICLSYLIAF